MNGESERGSGRGASVASQALVPGEAPMSALGSGDEWRGYLSPRHFCEKRKVD